MRKFFFKLFDRSTTEEQKTAQVAVAQCTAPYVQFDNKPAPTAFTVTTPATKPQ